MSCKSSRVGPSFCWLSWPFVMAAGCQWTTTTESERDSDQSLQQQQQQQLGDSYRIKRLVPLGAFWYLCNSHLLCRRFFFLLPWTLPSFSSRVSYFLAPSGCAGVGGGSAPLLTEGTCTEHKNISRSTGLFRSIDPFRFEAIERQLGRQTTGEDDHPLSVHSGSTTRTNVEQQRLYTHRVIELIKSSKLAVADERASSHSPLPFHAQIQSRDFHFISC